MSTAGCGVPDRVVRVLLVDDDALVRAGLTMMLDGTSGLRVVGEAADGDEVAAAVDRLSPDVVLMDIRMPRVDGLAATRALCAAPDHPAVLVLTTFESDAGVVEALRSGASGFLVKDTPPADIVAAVLDVAAGNASLSPTAARRIVDHVAAGGEGDGRREGARARLSGLPERERAVALLVGEGASNAEISAKLYLSVPTVKAYVSRLLARLGVENRVHVALLVHDAEPIGLPSDGATGDGADGSEGTHVRR